MDLRLVRKKINANGCFGVLLDTSGNQIAVTLEHAFDDGNMQLAPAIPVGVYVCQRGTHTIEDGKGPFCTFQIMNVAGHVGCLFHTGNWQSDSRGCVLIGLEILESMITRSQDTFNAFMQLQTGIDQFTLKVE